MILSIHRVSKIFGLAVLATFLLLGLAVPAQAECTNECVGGWVSTGNLVQSEETHPMSEWDSCSPGFFPVDPTGGQAPSYQCFGFVFEMTWSPCASQVQVCSSPCEYSGGLGWGSGCYAEGYFSANSGDYVEIGNQSPGYDGAIGYTCSNGSWVGPATEWCSATVIVVYGCTDSSASNYNASATTDDGSCTYPVLGCTNSSAQNYNPSATSDDGSCTYEACADFGTVSWGVGCSAAGYYETESGQTVTVLNQESGYTGQQQYLCSSGSWYLQSESCAQACASGYGNSCESSPNNCGATNTGTIQCNGSCSATAPHNGEGCSQQPGASATLSANPTAIAQGQSSTLTWNSSDSTTCNGTGFNTSTQTSGSVSTGTLNDPGPQTYQVVCNGPGGQSSPSFATVEVLAPEATISANPTRVNSGSTSQISWSGTGVTSCTVSGPGGTLASGSSDEDFAFTTGSPQSVTISSQSLFTISCDVNGSPVSQTATVNIIPLFQEF